MYDAARNPVPRRTVRMRSPAKVNLHLEVLRKRRDGYHEIETILQAVDWFDTLDLSLEDPAPGAPLRVSLSVDPYEAAPEGPENLCWRAAELFGRSVGMGGRLRIVLRKDIPAAAGLGGGSGNAAAVLVACDRLFRTGLPDETLHELAAQLGSDVPFFLKGGTAVGRGRGTELTRLAPIRRGKFLIVLPNKKLATDQVYNRLNMGLTRRSPKVNIRNTEALIARFPTGSWFGYNRLEEVVLPAEPVLQRILLHLKERAPIAMLSGSGGAVYAVFDPRDWDPSFLTDLGEPGVTARVFQPHPAGVEFMEDVTTRLLA